MSNKKDGNDHPNMNFEDDVYNSKFDRSSVGTVMLYGMPPMDLTGPSFPNDSTTPINPILPIVQPIAPYIPIADQSKNNKFKEKINKIVACLNKASTATDREDVVFGFAKVQILLDELLKENNISHKDIEAVMQLMGKNDISK